MTGAVSSIRCTDLATAGLETLSGERPGLSAIASVLRATLRPERADRLPRAMLAMAAWGPTLAGALAAATARYPRADALVDDEGALTYGDMWRASDGIARGLRAQGVGPGKTVGLLARNDRTFVLGLAAASKLGADLVYLNTGFAAPQLADVVAAESVDTVLYDDEFADVVAAAGLRGAVSGTEMRTMAAAHSLLPLVPVRHAGRNVVLTSGTTGRPKGASRSGTGGGIGAILPVLSSIPLRARDTVVVAAPLFHAWGLANLGLGLGTSSTLVLQRRFDPEATLAAVAKHRANGLVVVPVMLRRVLDLDAETLARYDTSSLRYIAASGSALGVPLVTAALRQFGPILYNVYGSTEVSLATIAGPDDLQAAPATAGRRLPGVEVRVLDERGDEVGPGVAGRVFVGSGSQFEGYTGGGTKESIGGLLSSGDVGHFDNDGRLFIDGRDDDMIVSGGENVFPSEVEDLIAGLPAVAEAAVIGVSDDEFGQRLKAFVVRHPGARLTEKAVKDHVRAHLARYKVPREVVFLDELPRTTTGKVRKTDLR